MVTSFDLSGTVTMNGGEISGNTARYGGGVYASTNSVFLKTGAPAGGTISGYISSSNTDSNVVGTLTSPVSNRGHAVYVSSVSLSPKRRETTAGPEVNLDSGVAGSAGGWGN